jgi:uncharacterized membrane protein
MEHLETPAFLVMLHQLPLLLMLAFLAGQGLTSLSVTGITPSEMRAAIPSAIFEALQLILFFAAMNQGHAVVVVAATASAGTLLASFVPMAALQSE